MATPEDVRKLAALARLSVAEDELPKLVAEFDGILAYVSTLESLTVPAAHERRVPELRNVFREDGEPHAPGRYTEALAEQFPSRDGDSLSVKQIISYE